MLNWELEVGDLFLQGVRVFLVKLDPEDYSVWRS